MERVFRILFLITDLNMGGTEKVVFETVTRIDKNRFQPVVVSFKKNGTYAQRIREAGIPVETLDLHGVPWLFPIKFLSALFRLARRAKKERISLIHAFLFQANIIAKIVGKLSAVPVIVSHRGFEKPGSWKYLLERLTNRWARAILVNSDALRREVSRQLKLPREAIRTVYNGVEVDAGPAGDRDGLIKEFSLRETDVIVVSVGRLHPVKGFQHLIEAAALTRHRGPGGRRIVFLIAGDGPDRAALNELTFARDMSRRIVLCGWRDDTRRIVAGADIFVLPSLAEGFPNAVLEAMAMGKPVIASSVGGVPEMIDNANSGMLVPPANVPALAERIALLAADPELRAKLGANARSKVISTFTMDRMIRGHEALYTEILGSRS